MRSLNCLSAAPPYPVERAIKKLGTSLRMARLRRNLTLIEIAEKIGVGRRAVSDAEKGKPSASIAIYVALLWALDLVDQFPDIADPLQNEKARALAHSRESARVGTPEELDDDF